MLVPRPGAVRTSNWAPRFSARARILESPKPSPLANCGSAMHEPLSVTSRTRLGGSPRTLTMMTGRLGMAHRHADGFLRSPEQLVPGRARQAFFGYIAGMKITPQPGGDVATLDQLLQRPG